MVSLKSFKQEEDIGSTAEVWRLMGRTGGDARKVKAVLFQGKGIFLFNNVGESCLSIFMPRRMQHD